MTAALADTAVIAVGVATTLPDGTVPWLAAALVTTAGLVIRAGLQELRWWLALRGTTPSDRAAIIKALGAVPASSRPRRPPRRIPPGAGP